MLSGNMISLVNILLLMTIMNPPAELQICLIDNHGVENPWIFGSDIKTYDWDSHTVYIVHDSVKAVTSRSISCTGFSVKIGDTTLYEGVCDLSYNSFIGHKSPTIFVWEDGLPSINLKCDCFSIYYFGEKEAEDRRFDALLYKCLKERKQIQ